MSSSDTDMAGVGPEAAGAEEKQRLSLDVKVEQPSSCQRHLTVTVSREDVDRYLKQAYDKLMPEAAVPGFRPGRAPRKLVESRFKEQVREQIKGELLMDSLTQVTEEQEFSAISEPEFDYEAIEIPDEGPFTYEFDLEVRPEFDLPEWKGLEVEKPVHEFTENEVKQRARELLAEHGELKPKQEPAQAGDLVTLEIVFRHEGKTISKVTEENVPLRPILSFRDGRLEGFDELMSGAQKGDRREGKVKISPDAEQEELRGQEIDVQFEVLEVNQLDLPEFNAEFLSGFGLESEEQLYETVRSSLERQLAYQQQQQIRQQITSKLLKDAEWDLPPDTLRRQAQRELQRAVMELQASGFSNDVILAHENELRQNSLASTAKALKEHFILERIAEEQEVDASDEDYDREIMMIAMQRNEAPRRVRARLEKRGQMDALRNQIVERKVIELITSQANFKEVPFEPQGNRTAAIDYSITGARDDGEIPEAKHGANVEQLRHVVERE